jgi:molybdopterin molybdotransferase
MARDLITVREAQRKVLDATPRLGSEQVEVGAALRRVLVEEMRAAGDVPPFPCSAMDGYAIHAGPAGRRLAIVGESRAGTPSDAVVAPGEAIRISTGAAMPPGAESVIRQEDTAVQDDQIETLTAVRNGQNVRGAGEDMRAGALVLEAGTKLGAAELGAAIGAGASMLTVCVRPRVSVLCTGDELRAPGKPLGPGQIHNSNGPMLEALARECGAAIVDTSAATLPDDGGATEAALDAALGRSDLLVVSGGVSVGPHDHVRPALARLGVEQVFWRVALQPGKPTWFGVADRGRVVFGLPGNPVSAVVTFTLFVRRALEEMQGAKPQIACPTHARLAVAVRRDPEREQAIRVRLEQPDTTPIATPNGPQGSHIVTSLLGADALAMIPTGEGDLEAGAAVPLEPLVR